MVLGYLPTMTYKTGVNVGKYSTPWSIWAIDLIRLRPGRAP
jgi:hypothetical protein